MAPSPARTPAAWQLALARIEGALPYLSGTLSQILACRALRRLWAVHIRDFAFESIGLEHNPGLEADELMRSWYATERGDFLSWISRRGPPALAQAARTAMAAKGLSESFTAAYDPAERALVRLDDLLPSQDPITTLTELVRQLREDEIEFLEGGTEIGLFEGRAFDRPAPKGAAWAASLALAMRPQLFALGSAPLALAGLAPRALFRLEPEEPIATILRDALTTATSNLGSDLDLIRHALILADERLGTLYASSRAPDAFTLLIGLGPLTRAELARALSVTKRTTSQAAIALENLGMVEMRPSDGALMETVPLNR